MLYIDSTCVFYDTYVSDVLNKHQACFFSVIFFENKTMERKP